MGAMKAKFKAKTKKGPLNDKKNEIASLFYA